MAEALNLSRKQVLVRQIDTAIWLLRVRNEPIVAHLVANAAIDVLRSLAREAGARTLKGKLEEYINPERIKEYRELDRAAYNFAKHADRDPAAELENFKPELAEYNVLAAVIDFGEVFEKNTPFMLVFRSFFMAKNPHLLSEGDFKNLHHNFNQIVHIQGGDHDALCSDLLSFLEANPGAIRAWNLDYIEPTETFLLG